MQFYSLIGQSKIMYIAYLLYVGHLMMLSSTQVLTSISLSDQMVSQHALTCVSIKLGKGSPLINVPMYASASLMYSYDYAGTGKSSIVCAMCLGLGGSPRLLGRAKDVRYSAP